MFETFGMMKCNGVVTSMKKNYLISENRESISINTPYREAIGSLLYLVYKARHCVCYKHYVSGHVYANGERLVSSQTHIQIFERHITLGDHVQQYWQF